MARKAGQGKEEEESRARQQEGKTPVREEEKTPACDGRGHHVVEPDRKEEMLRDVYLYAANTCCSDWLINKAALAYDRAGSISISLAPFQHHWLHFNTIRSTEGFWTDTNPKLLLLENLKARRACKAIGFKKMTGPKSEKYAAILSNTESHRENISGYGTRCFGCYRFGGGLNDGVHKLIGSGDIRRCGLVR
ncbi:hypothetical protein STEG23_000350, partial [Scotinomys teguina]